MSEFMNELKKYHIKVDFDSVLRPILKEGDPTARKHYSKILRENPEYEKNLLLELAQTNKYLYDFLFERMAISGLTNLEQALDMLMKYENE